MIRQTALISVMGLCGALHALNAANCLEGIVLVRQSGTTVPSARVQVNGVIETTTDALGHFAFAQLPPRGTHILTVTAPGFEPFRREGIAASCSEPISLELQLELAKVSEIVTVEDRLESLRSNAPEISQTITTRQIRELPSNGRSWARLALLDPHVRNTGGLGSDGSTAARLSINASSFRHTSYTLDGNTNYDFIFANAPQQNLSLSAVQELKVLTNQYSAEYGTSTAGILVASTKSGANDFHGEVFGFLRPSGIQAAPPVSPFRVPNQRAQWGASASGPILRDRTHFFASYEDVRQHRGSYIQSPAPSFFIGDFSEHMGLVRMDRRWSDRHSSTLRLNGNHSTNNNVNDRVGGFTQPSAAQKNLAQSFGVQATERAIFGEWLNELRASYTNYTPSATSALSPQVSIVRPNYSTEGGSTTSWVRAQNYHFADVLALHHGNHDLKLGLDYLRLFVKDFSYTPFGEYRFAAGPPSPAQQPQTFNQTFGSALIHYGQSLAMGFVQDDWRVRPGLTLNLGLRYERQSLTADRNNFAPRIGLAWDITGAGRTTVRAGAGVFYDQYYLYITRRFFLQGLDSPQATYSIPFGAAGFPSFPGSLATEPSQSPAGKRDIYLPASRLYNPYSLQYSLGVQHRVSDWVFSVDGIHSQTLRQMRVNDVNHPAPFLRTAPSQRRTGVEADATRPYQTYAGIPVRNITVVENSGSTLYDALDLGVLKRMASRYQLEAHYVYSSSSTYAMFFGEPNTGIPNDWGNTGTAERGPSDFYQRHRMVSNAIIDLPWQSQVTLIGTLASGLPVNPLTGADNNGDTFSSDRPAAFGRNSFRAPYQAQLDLAFTKRWKLNERVHLESRGEVFNVFNRNNYIKVNAVYGEGPRPSPTFLAPIAGVANVDPSRQFQGSLRLTF